MRKTKLPRRELEICRRLRLFREERQWTHKSCAEQLGIPRTTYVNYEVGKAPLWSEVGLRFCRQFIVSEEWLATGRFDALESEARKRGTITRENEKMGSLEDVFKRQCMDLQSDPVARTVPPGSLFSAAFDHFLSGRYRALVAESFYLPRVVFNDHDGLNIYANLREAMLERWVMIIQNEARRRGEDAVRANREFERCLFECGYLIFRKFMGDAHAKEQVRAFLADSIAPGGTMNAEKNPGLAADLQHSEQLERA